MIRVQYQWQVEDNQVAAFVAAWKTMTLAIRASRPGARGSQLLRGELPGRFVAIAGWESRAAWEASGALPSADPEAGAKMRAAATFVSTDVFELVEDLTI